MNRRLGEYILPYNKRKDYPLVDNKIKTYYLAKKYGIAQPEHFFHVSSHGDLKNIETALKDTDSFAVKPCSGAMGNGILIVNETLRDDKGETIYATSRGDLTIKQFKQYVSNILSGMYALSGRPDQAIVQEKLKTHPLLAPYSYKGIADLRVIVFQGFPVMAMLRLPTKLSRGRANLHQGAVGCGLEISSGRVCDSIYLNRRISAHPDTSMPFKELELPDWKELLVQASQCYDVTEMGYLGVDLVLDEERGGLLLEMNARPGLSIQTANMQGLVTRLERIKKELKGSAKNLEAQERVELAMKLF